MGRWSNRAQILAVLECSFLKLLFFRSSSKEKMLALTINMVQRFLLTTCTTLRKKNEYKNEKKWMEQDLQP